MGGTRDGMTVGFIPHPVHGMPPVVNVQHLGVDPANPAAVTVLVEVYARLDDPDGRFAGGYVFTGRTFGDIPI